MFGLRVGASGMSGAHGRRHGRREHPSRPGEATGGLRLALGPTASERRPPARRTGRNARHRGGGRGRAGGRTGGSEITLDFAAKHTSSLRLSS